VALAIFRLAQETLPNRLQGIALYGFLDDGQSEMVKLLPVAHECFRK